MTCKHENTNLVEDISCILYSVQVQRLDVLPFIKVAINFGYGSAQCAQFPIKENQGYFHTPTEDWKYVKILYCIIIFQSVRPFVQCRMAFREKTVHRYLWFRELIPHVLACDTLTRVKTLQGPKTVLLIAKKAKTSKQVDNSCPKCIAMQFTEFNIWK